MSPHHPHDTDWSDEMLIARLRELHAEGIRYADIADILSAEFHVKLGKNAIVGKVHRLRLEKRERGPRPKPEPAIEPEVITVKVNRHWTIELPQAVGNRISIWELEQGRCHFPHGQRPPYDYCGKDAPSGPYCAHHQRVMYGNRLPAR